ncbi:hypothetical protein HY009_06770 [Candidatus Acetothermia bacterium]|nr:hypothetical protein [Candidatus Acetothermia bacterium]
MGVMVGQETVYALQAIPVKCFEGLDRVTVEQETMGWGDLVIQNIPDFVMGKAVVSFYS